MPLLTVAGVLDARPRAVLLTLAHVVRVLESVARIAAYAARRVHHVDALLHEMPIRWRLKSRAGSGWKTRAYS